MSSDIEAISAAALRRGQKHEEQSELAEALSSYDEAIAALGKLRLDDFELRRQLGVAWMNRGNALQKQNETAAAVEAFDEAIALLRGLPPTPQHRNHLGAAWLNRGHAILHGDDLPPEAEPTRSFEQAIAILADLPLNENPAYRLNLAGAWTNLAHSQLSTAPAQARQAANLALGLLTASSIDDLAFAAMSLRARRALVLALGELLSAAENAGELTAPLADEAIDVIEGGLAIARTWTERESAVVRPLALRLLRLGAQLYRVHQPHFLSEFLLENLESLRTGNVADDSEFRSAAEHALTAALADLERPRLLTADQPDALRLLETVRGLRAAQQQLKKISP